VGLLLSQGGEFGFIIFGAALALEILTFETTQILLAVVTLSMVSTPFMAYAGSRLSAFLEKHTKQDLGSVDI
jgi:glutathione-regulated potassium-efflux system protein KefB